MADTVKVSFHWVKGIKAMRKIDKKIWTKLKDNGPFTFQFTDYNSSLLSMKTLKLILYIQGLKLITIIWSKFDDDMMPYGHPSEK